jgi:pyruvate/2-oxoglutarate dehydrogenase complex dihydrolipoamide acyltransferase (E2) component
MQTSSNEGGKNPTREMPEDRQKNECEIIDFPRSRTIIVDTLEEGKKMHLAFGWGEVDVTVALQLIQAVKDQTGESLSFTAFVLYCMSKALDEFKPVQAVRKGKKLYIYDEIDISTMVERENSAGHKVLTTVIVRRANKKSFKELNDEIRAAQQCELNGVALGSSKEAKQTNMFSRLPKFLRSAIWRKVRGNPEFRKKTLGTAMLTSVGMFAPGGGFALTHSPWPVEVIVGGIVRRPAYEEGDIIAPHNFLCLTIGIDHGIVDGAPATRFATKLVKNLEAGLGLPEV